MDEIKKTKDSWLNNYKVKKVFSGRKLFKETVYYLKKQKNLDHSKVLFLFNSFIQKKYPVGYILMHRNIIVGFLGTIYSNKKILNKNFLNCNIHSWMVDGDHRVVSSILFNKIKKRSLITVLSALPKLSKTFIKLGFMKFTIKYKLVVIKKFFFKKNTNFNVETNFKKINKVINFENKKILKSYTNSKFKTFLLKKNKSEESCLIIADITTKKKIFKTMNIIYCSNSLFFKKNLSNFYSFIYKNFKILLCGEFYLKKSESLLNKNLSIIKNKNIYLKGFFPKFKFDLLYSETDF
jgi:hypothetical protein